MATFTYQVAYWGWVKLEKDEIRAEKTGWCSLRQVGLQGVKIDADMFPTVEIKELEQRLADLTKAKDQPKP